MINPQDTDLLRWADALIIDFPEDQIPVLLDENSWKSWGNEVIQSPNFFINNAPGTTAFKDWRDWARAVYSVMSPQNT